jgi:hypothetical protein
MTRTKYVPSEKEMEKKVDELVTRGYKIKQQGRQSTRVKEKDWGEIPVHGFLFLFTLLGAAVLFSETNAPSGSVFLVAIAANLIYAAYCWSSAEEVIVKVENKSDEQTEQASRNQTRSQKSPNQAQRDHSKAGQRNISKDDIRERSGGQEIDRTQGKGDESN